MTFYVQDIDIRPTSMVDINGGIGLLGAALICAGCFVVGAIIVAGICFLVG